MLPPHELKNKSFSRAMRGYNSVEVDEYIDFIIEKYTELYRENDELEHKLKATVARLEEIKNDEDSIRGALIDAKRAAAKIKAEAEERAEAIIRSAKSSCNTILQDFNRKIEEGRDTLIEIKRDTQELKSELFERYSEHIRFLDKLTDGIEMDDIPDTAALRRSAVNSLKASIAEAYASMTQTSRPIVPTMIIMAAIKMPTASIIPTISTTTTLTALSVVSRLIMALKTRSNRKHRKITTKTTPRTAMRSASCPNRTSPRSTIR